MLRIELQISAVGAVHTKDLLTISEEPMWYQHTVLVLNKYTSHKKHKSSLTKLKIVELMIYQQALPSKHHFVSH